MTPGVVEFIVEVRIVENVEAVDVRNDSCDCGQSSIPHMI